MADKFDEGKYLKAVQALEKQEALLNSELVPRKYTCIACKKAEVELMVDMSISLPSRQEQACWNDGAVAKLTAGYGSKHDAGESFYLAVCDDCMDNDPLIVPTPKLPEAVSRFNYIKQRR